MKRLGGTSEGRWSGSTQGFVQKQVPDRRRIWNKMTLALTLPSDGRDL